MSDERLSRRSAEGAKAEVDRVIDEVAWQMTEGLPPADFRARIVARLDAGDRPRRFWPAAWLLSPIGVAAAIVLAILVARPFKGGDVVPASMGRTVQLPGPPSSQSDVAATRKPNTTYEGVDDAVRPRNRRPDPFERRAASEIDALAPPPLDVVPLVVQALSTPSIAITQLDAIAPIAIEPLPETRSTNVEGDRQ